MNIETIGMRFTKWYIQFKGTVKGDSYGESNYTVECNWTEGLGGFFLERWGSGQKICYEETLGNKIERHFKEDIAK